MASLVSALSRVLLSKTEQMSHFVQYASSILICIKTKVREFRVSECKLTTVTTIT